MISTGPDRLPLQQSPNAVLVDGFVVPPGHAAFLSLPPEPQQMLCRGMHHLLYCCSSLVKQQSGGVSDLKLGRYKSGGG